MFQREEDPMGYILAVIVGMTLSALTYGVLSVNSYDKGYEDGRQAAKSEK